MTLSPSIQSDCSNSSQSAYRRQISGTKKGKKGNDYINRKVLEEANELIEAVNKKDKNHIIHEAADLWFHSLVSLSFNGISSKDILAELNARFGLSGLEEKKLRYKCI